MGVFTSTCYSFDDLAQITSVIQSADCTAIVEIDDVLCLSPDIIDASLAPSITGSNPITTSSSSIDPGSFTGTDAANLEKPITGTVCLFDVDFDAFGPYYKAAALLTNGIRINDIDSIDPTGPWMKIRNVPYDTDSCSAQLASFTSPEQEQARTCALLPVYEGDSTSTLGLNGVVCTKLSKVTVEGTFSGTGTDLIGDGSGVWEGEISESPKNYGGLKSTIVYVTGPLVSPTDATKHYKGLYVGYTLPTDGQGLMDSQLSETHYWVDTSVPHAGVAQCPVMVVNLPEYNSDMAVSDVSISPVLTADNPPWLANRYTDYPLQGVIMYDSCVTRSDGTFFGSVVGVTIDRLDPAVFKIEQVQIIGSTYPSDGNPHTFVSVTYDIRTIPGGEEFYGVDADTSKTIYRILPPVFRYGTTDSLLVEDAGVGNFGIMYTLDDGSGTGSTIKQVHLLTEVVSYRTCT